MSENDIDSPETLTAHGGRPAVPGSAREKRRAAHFELALFLVFDLMDGQSGMRKEIQWQAVHRHLKWAGKSHEDLINHAREAALQNASTDAQ